MENPLIVILVALAGCSGFFSLIQTILQRKWMKKDRTDEVLAKISSLEESTNTSIEDVRKTTFAAIEDVKSCLDKHVADEEMQAALQARSRILRGATDIKDGRDVSGELLENLMDDITFYTKYCENNPGFLNNKSKLSIKMIENKFMEISKGE